MIQYVFREDEPIRIKAAGKANPQVIGEALQKIAEKSGGSLEPRKVVEEARAETHPLHVHFEWDNSIAAEAYRMDQARNIIRIIRVEDKNAPDGNVRAFLSVSDRDGTAYQAVGQVRRSLEMQLALMRSAERDLQAFERRYREFSDLCSLVQSAKVIAAERRQELESRIAA